MKILINGVVTEVDNDALKKAIEDNSESFEIKSEDFVIRTAEDQTTYETNLKSASQTIGEEIGRKNLFKALDIDIEGTGAHKDVNKSVETLTGWSNGLTQKAITDANIEPNKKVEELTRDLETLRNSKTEAETKYSDLQNQFTSYKNDLTVSNAFNNAMPDNLTIPKDDMSMLVRNKIKTGFDDNGNITVLDANGNVKKDSNLNPVTLESEINSFFDQNKMYLKKAEGGSGEGDSTGGNGNGKQSLEAFTKEMSEQGIKPNTEQFNSIMSDRIKAGSLDM